MNIITALPLSAALACLPFSGSASAGESPLRDRMLIRGIETGVLASLKSQDDASESFEEGGISGGTHLLLGGALAVGGLWLMMSLMAPDVEDNSANQIIAIGAPVAAVGGVAEMVYGVVKMIRTRNQIH